MKNLKYCLLATGIVLLSFSCKKKEIEEEKEEEEMVISGIALDNFFDSNVTEKEQYWSVPAEDPFYVVSEKGTALYLPGNSLKDADGNLVTGDVDITFIEIDKKSEMILLNKSTACVLPNGDHSTLISDGEFYISIAQNDEPLTLTANLTVFTTIPLDDPEMHKFVNVSETENLLWKIAGDSILMMDGEIEGSSSFYMPPGDNWGWVNLDKYAADPRPKTGIYAELPEGFTNENASIFASFNGENAMAHFGTWIDGRYEHAYPTFPIGLEVNFVVIAMDGDHLKYAIQPATISNEHVEVITALNAVGLDDLEELIDALP